MSVSRLVLQQKADAGHKISMLTCYDYPTALWEDASGVDVVFVGDSVGTNVLGYRSEREVTLADMVHHLKAVRRGVQNAYLLVDMPYGTYGSPQDAIETARALIGYGADGVKLEGACPEIISHLSADGIEVWGHLGLNPQFDNTKGLRAKTLDSAVRLVDDALLLEQAGAAFMVFELIPEEVAPAATQRLRIPTIGIGAGRYTDGQVLIVCDLLGVNAFDLRHARKYQCFDDKAIAAIRAYVEDVVAGRFPGAAHARYLPSDIRDDFLRKQAAIAKASR